MPSNASHPQAVAAAAETASVVLRVVRAELDHLDRRRAEAVAIAREHWYGGDRARFEDRLAELERQARRARAAIEHLERIVVRAAEDAAAEARALAGGSAGAACRL
jgi:hypothetical protein